MWLESSVLFLFHPHKNSSSLVFRKKIGIIIIPENGMIYLLNCKIFVPLSIFYTIQTFNKLLLMYKISSLPPFRKRTKSDASFFLRSPNCVQQVKQPSCQGKKDNWRKLLLSIQPTSSTLLGDLRMILRPVGSLRAFCYGTTSTEIQEPYWKTTTSPFKVWISVIEINIENFIFSFI